MVTKKITFKINDIEVSGKEGDYIVDVARENGIDIPTLCMNGRLERIGACRQCVVEIEGARKLMSSCSTPIRDGLVVHTHTKRVLNARRLNMELILANHNRDCLTCVQNRDCELQRQADELMIEEVRYSGEKRKSTIDASSRSIVRDNSKCILCKQCIGMCNDVQSVFAIGQHERGFYTHVGSPLDIPLVDSACVNCGQCIIHCPTGALSEKSDIEKVRQALLSGKHVVAQTAPSIRSSLGEMFDMPDGSLVTGKMVTALKEVGFHKVFDTDLGADITILEEATEFVKRFKEKRDLPMITTCCPAWIKFGEQFFFEQLNHMSTCRSPQAMLASLIKTYYAKKNNLKKDDIVTVAIMPCTAKKFEVDRPEFAGETDFVLTTVELSKLLKLYNVDFKNLKDSDFDHPLGESSGAGVIFGRSGGVMEAALRTAADFITGKNIKEIEYHKVRGMATLKEADLTLAGQEIKIAVVHTLGEARKIMEDIRAGKSPYHFIEIMACYGGCIGGGGQPRFKDYSILQKRAKALNREDTGKKIRKSHKNPTVLKLYKEYIGGEPGSKIAHKLLHTKYVEREFI